ncbi:MAG: CHAT domain-containing protein [Saprospiraceae bacterium]|nr:CHAT domain-containing protein [Saprospiraceae bacterium]
MILLFACAKQKRDEKNIRSLIFIPDFHTNEAVYRFDSLAFAGNFSEAITLSDSLLEISPNVIHQYLQIRKLFLAASNESQNEDLYDSIKIIHSNNAIINALKDLSLFEYDYHHRPDSCNINALKESMISLPLYYQTTALNRVGEYYKSVVFNLDSTWHYFQKAYNKLNTIPSLTQEHLYCIERLSILCTYKRKNLLGIKYANEAAEIDKYYLKLTPEMKVRIYNNRAFMLFRENDFEGSYIDADIALTQFDSLENNALYQEVMKTYIILSMLEGNDSIYGVYYKKLVENINTSGKDFVGLDRLIGQKLYYDQQYSGAIPYLIKGLHFLQNSPYDHSAIFSNLCYQLSDCYEHLENHQKSLDYIALNFGIISDYGFQDLMKKMNEKSVYSFVSATRCAEIYMNKFETDKKPESLYNAFEMVQFVDSIIFRQMNVSEESAILQFYLEYGESYFHTGIEVCYELWKLTNEQKYKELMILYCEKSKNSLLYRDFMMANKNTIIPDSIILAERNCKADIKKEQLKGLRNNTRFNHLMNRYAALEEKIEQYVPDFYQNPLIAKTETISEIIDKIPDEKTTILLISEIKDVWFFIAITRNEIYTSKIHANELLLSQMDSLLLMEKHERMISDFESAIIAHSVFQKLFDDKIINLFSEHIRIIPDGYFNRFPLSILVENLTVSSKTDIDYFHKKHQLSYCPSVKMMSSEKVENQDQATGKVAVFAFSDKETILSSERSHLPELPGTYREALFIQKKYPSAKIFSGNAATIKNFKKVYQDSTYKYIHLALHGISNSRMKDDVKLYFRTESGGIDSLYGYELLTLKSKATKIVLSACQSGTGQYQNGEGNYSLPRYFMINGARDVTASLWDLDDIFSYNKFQPGLIRYQL